MNKEQFFKYLDDMINQQITAAMNLAYSFGMSSYGATLPKRIQIVENSNSDDLVTHEFIFVGVALDDHQKQLILNTLHYFSTWEAIPEDIRKIIETSFENGYQSAQRRYIC